MYDRKGIYSPQARVNISKFKTDYIDPAYGQENYRGHLGTIPIGNSRFICFLRYFNQ